MEKMKVFVVFAAALMLVSLGSGSVFTSVSGGSDDTYNSFKDVNITDFNDAGASINKVQPVILTCGDDSTNGTGEIVIDCSRVDGREAVDFSNSTGHRKSFEWESFNLTNSTTGYHEAVAWIHGDWLRDNTTQLKVHYGDGSTVENGANPWGEAGVNAVMVQHLNESPMTQGDTVFDSSPNGNDGTWETGSDGQDKSTTGEFDGAASFDGTNDYINGPSDSTISQIINDDTGTVVAWAGVGTISQSDTYAFDYGGNGFSLIYGYDTDKWEMFSGNPATSVDISTVSDTSSHLLGFTADNQNITTYFDGTSQNTGTVELGDGDIDSGWTLGESGAGAANWEGVQSEVRVYSDSKGSNWWQADYDASPKAGQTFFSWSGAESTGTKPVFNSVSTEPDTWVFNESVNVTANVTDDGSVEFVTADVYEDGVKIVDNKSLSEEISGNWTVDNLFTVTKDETFYNVTLTATDNDGSTSNFETQQFIDETPPRITIHQPENQTYYLDKGNIPLNYTVTDPNLDTCKYQVKDENHSLPDCTNTTIDLSGTPAETKKITVYASDTYENTGDKSQTFQGDYLNQYELQDTSSNNIDNYQVTISNDTHSIGGTVNKSFKFNTSEAPKGNVSIKFKKEGYLSRTIYDNITDTYNINQTFTVEKAGFTLQVFNEETGSKLLQPRSITLSNSSKNYEYYWGNSFKSLEGANSDFTRDDWDNPSNAFDEDLTTSMHVYTGDTSSSYDDAYLYGKVSVKPGTNVLYHNATVHDYLVDYSVEIQTESGSWQILEQSSDSGTLPSPQITFENDGSLTNNIRILYDMRDQESLYVYEIYANNLENPEWNYENSLVTGETEITVKSKNYNQRTYYTDISPYSKTLLDTYLLKSGKGIYTSIEVYDASMSIVENAKVSLQKNIDGTWKTVDQKKTSSSGAISTYLDPEQKYKAVVQHPNYVSAEVLFNPANYDLEPLQIQLSEETSSEYKNLWNTISVKILPETKTVNATETQFNYSIYDSQAMLETYSLKIQNMTNHTIGEVSGSGSPSGTTLNLTVNLSQFQDQQIQAIGTFVKNQTTYKYTKHYRVQKPWLKGDYAFITTFNDISEQLNDFPKALIAIFLTLFIGIGLGRNIHRAGGGLITLTMLGIFADAGWINTSLFTISLLAAIAAILYPRS